MKIKNWGHYIFNEIINIKEFDSNLLKIGKKTYKVLTFITLGI